MVAALNLQQFQYDLKKIFLRRLVFPMLFCFFVKVRVPPWGGGVARGGGLQEGAGG